MQETEKQEDERKLREEMLRLSEATCTPVCVKEPSWGDHGRRAAPVRCTYVTGLRRLRNEPATYLLRTLVYYSYYGVLNGYHTE